MILNGIHWSRSIDCLKCYTRLYWTNFDKHETFHFISSCWSINHFLWYNCGLLKMFVKQSMSRYIFNACSDFQISKFQKNLSNSTLRVSFVYGYEQIYIYRFYLLFYFHESINQWDDDTFQQKNDSFKVHSNYKDVTNELKQKTKNTNKYHNQIWLNYGYPCLLVLTRIHKNIRIWSLRFTEFAPFGWFHRNTVWICIVLSGWWIHRDLITRSTSNFFFRINLCGIAFVSCIVNEYQSVCMHINEIC